MSVLSRPRFHDEAAAFAYLESIVLADAGVPMACFVTAPSNLPSCSPRDESCAGDHATKDATTEANQEYENAPCADTQACRVIPPVELLMPAKRGFAVRLAGRARLAQGPAEDREPPCDSIARRISISICTALAGTCSRTDVARGRRPADQRSDELLLLLDHVARR
jgi:hypothetical protein